MLSHRPARPACTGDRYLGPVNELPPVHGTWAMRMLPTQTPTQPHGQGSIFLTDVSFPPHLLGTLKTGRVRAKYRFGTEQYRLEISL